MEKLHLETVQWRHLVDIDEVLPLSDDDHAVLKEIGDILRRHQLTDRFGVCLLHKHFDISGDEELVEETDAESRVSTVRVAKRVNNSGRTIETMWRYANGITAATVCEKICDYNNGHKKIHTKVPR
jgi:hypothetical protein